MTTEQGYRFITRGIAVCLLIWVVSDLIGLPSDLLGVFHHWRDLNLAESVGRSSPYDSYWLRFDILTLGERVIRMAAMLWAVGWFYRGSDGLRKFFDVPAS